MLLPPKNEETKKWLFGVVIALGFVAYGGSVLLAGHARIRTGSRFSIARSSIELNGFDATLYGLALISAALALHFAFVWAHSDRFYGYGEIGRNVSLIVLSVLVLVLLARQAMNFI